MKRKALRFYCLAISLMVVLLGFVCSANADITLTLPNNFIEKYKNRATIETDFNIYYAHDKPKKPSPKKPSNDGDIHIAGVPAEFPMPTVAELMNAASQPKALAYANKMKGTGTPVRIVGVWRFWPEHGGDDIFFQGMPLDIQNTNPNHVFEIHPISEIGGIDTTSSFAPITGFKEKEATDAFQRYENIRSRISVGPDSTSIRMGSVGYNYVKFRIKLCEDPTHEMADGLTVFADVKEVDGETLVRKRRMVFITGTAPEKAVRMLKKGDCMLVLGMPRINLSILAWRAAHSTENPDVLSWSLPYEMVIVGVYGDHRCEP